MNKKNRHNEYIYPAIQNAPADIRKYPKSPFPATPSFDRSHTLPSPVLSDDDFNYIPGTYIKNHIEIPTEQQLATMTEERKWDDEW